MNRSEPRTAEDAITQAAFLAAPIFAQMGWVWASTSPRTPSVAEIKETYWKLYQDALNYDGKHVTSGRLRVDNDYGNWIFSLELAEPM